MEHMEEFLTFAAEVLGVGREAVSLELGMGGVPQWDSLMQLRLLAEVEDRYGVEVPFSAVEGLKTLADFYRLTEGAAR